MEDSKERRSAQQDQHVYQSVDDIFEDSKSTWIRNQGFRNYGYYTGSIASSGVETYAAPTAYGPSQNYGLYSSGMYSDPAQSGPSHVTSYNSMTRRVAPRSNKKSRCTRCSRKCCVIATLLSLGLTALLAMVLLLSQGVIGSSPAIISVAGQMRVTSWSYTESLSDPLSEAFLNYRDLFCRELELVARNTSNDAEFDTCNVVAFSPGSVMVDFELLFRRISSNLPNNITAQFGHNLVASIASGWSFTTIDIDRSNIFVEGTAYSDTITTETVSQLVITGDPVTSRVETMMASRTYTVERIDQSTKPTDIDKTTVVSRSTKIDETTVVSSNPDIDQTTVVSRSPEIDETTVVSSNPDIDETTVVTRSPETDETTVLSSHPDINETTVVSRSTEIDETTVVSSNPDIDETTVVTRSPETDETTVVSSHPDINETTVVSRSSEIDETTVVSSNPDIDETTVVTRSPEIDETTVGSSNPDIVETTVVSSNPDIDETTVVSSNPDIDVTTVVSSHPNINETTVVSRSTEIDETTVVTSNPDIDETTLMSSNPEIDETTVVSSNPEIDETTVVSSNPDIDETTVVSPTTDISQKTTMIDLTFNTRSDSTDAATTDLSTATTDQVYTDTSVTYYLTDEYDTNTASYPTDTTTRHGSTDNVVTDVTENDQSSTPRPTVSCRKPYVPCADGRQCINARLQCNDVIDCVDGSDEVGCSCEERNMFQCASGDQCVVIGQVCDGWTDCGDYSDELNCECSDPSLYQCVNTTQCIASWMVCDQIVHCADASDETNCSCGEEYFQCFNSTQCVELGFLCDFYTDCEDGSDEVNCSCEAERGRFRCHDNAGCIESGRVCDGDTDCFDRSDELNCTCEQLYGSTALGGYVRCDDADGKCIPHDWLCDGHVDCELGQDESACNVSCRNGEFLCRHQDNCIAMAAVCDGTDDCTDRSDEHGCLTLTLSPNSSQTILQIYKNQTWLPVCGQNWTNQLSHLACEQLSLGPLLMESPIELPNITSDVTEFMVLYDPLSPDQRTNLITATHTSLVCPVGWLVGVTCDEPACGRRADNIQHPQRLVTNSDEAKAGMWPWQAQLLYQGQHLCGGTVISRSWIVTAAHCILSDFETSHYTILLGSILNIEDNPDAKAFEVTQIIVHPSFIENGFQNDIALLRVHRDINVTDYIRPVCLPEANHESYDHTVCYVTGWGVTQPQGLVSTTLRQGRFHLLRPEVCNDEISRLHGNDAVDVIGVNASTMQCAGFINGYISGCSGDSGGPLICQRGYHGEWTLVGVVSRGPTQLCDSISIFTKVSAFVDWILYHTRQLNDR